MVLTKGGSVEKVAERGLKWKGGQERDKEKGVGYRRERVGGKDK